MDITRNITKEQAEMAKDIAEWIKTDDNGYPYLSEEAPDDIVEKYNRLKEAFNSHYE